jgi:large subunit ribosomal protein L24
MRRFHVKKGEEVVVISGTERGRRGKVLEVLAKNERVVVEGVKMIKKHMRKSQTHPNGGIIDREGSLHISNVMKADLFDARAAKRSSTTQA